MRDNKVQAVTRAIALLERIADQPHGIGVAELARQTALHKSTVSRLVMTLEAAGVVCRVGGRSLLQIAPEFADRFLTLHSPNLLVGVVRPFLRELSLQLNEAAGLAIPDGTQAVYVAQVSPNTTIQVRDWTGSRFPFHTVSAGKLFLAHLDGAAQTDYLSQPLAAYTNNTVTDPGQLRQSLKEIQQSGISWIFDEFADGLSAVAAPIFDNKGMVIAALSLYGPSYRFPEADKIEEINALISQYARHCTQQLQSIAERKGEENESS